MEPKFCQSCTMPIDNEEDRGTELDGSKSNDYCKYCYQNGSFVNPRMTITEMKSFIDKKMKELNIPSSITERSLQSLPFLKRWRLPVS